jgi:hypothetical protein
MLGPFQGRIAYSPFQVGNLPVQDGNYLSARRPGDAYLFARRLIALLRAF